MNKDSERNIIKTIIIVALLVVTLFVTSLYLIKNAESLTLTSDENGPFMIYKNGYREYSFRSRSIASDSEMHFYLPSFVKGEKLNIQTDIEVIVDGVSYSVGDKVDIYDIESISINNTNYDINYLENKTIFIDVDELGLESIRTDKENITEDVVYNMVEENGKSILASDKLSLKCRGNTTFNLAQKSYEIELEDSIDFGLGWGNKYRLIAGYNDPLKLRNEIAYNLAFDAGLNSPQVDTYNLYINGNYEGLYLITSDIFKDEEEVKKVNEDKGELVTLPLTDDSTYLRLYYYDGNTLDSNSSKYIIELDYNQNLDKEGFVTRRSIPLLIKKTKDLSFNEVNGLFKLFEDFENSLFKDDDSYLEYIDLDSWAKKYLFEELIYNMDCQISSAYYYVNKGEDKIYVGPCWDYDNSLISGTIPNDLRCYYRDTTMGESNLWYSLLSQKDSFMNRVLELYESNFQDSVDKYVNSYILKLADNYKNDALLDYELYHKEKINSETYDELLDEYYNLFKDHSTFVLEYLNNRDDYVMLTYGCYEVELFRLRHIVIKKGTSILDTAEVPYEIDWYDINTWVDENIEEFDFSQKIEEDTTVYAYKSFWSTYYR